MSGDDKLWRPPVWSRWHDRGVATLEEFVALSLGAEPAVYLLESAPPSPPPDRETYRATMRAVKRLHPASGSPVGVKIKQAGPLLSADGKNRLVQPRDAVKAGEVRASPDEARRWPLRKLAQWAARVRWEVPPELSDLGVFTLLELAFELASPGPGAGNPWPEACADDTYRLIDDAVADGKLPALHPTHLLPVDPAEWHEPSRSQLVVRWDDVQAWRRAPARAVRLPHQQREDGREAAPAVEKRQAPAQDAAKRAPDALKKSALISRHMARWSNIEHHLREASRNGLRDAAWVRHGYYSESQAVAWAKAGGHYEERLSPQLSALPARKHTIR